MRRTLKLIILDYNNLYNLVKNSFLMKFRENLWSEEVWNSLVVPLSSKRSKLEKDYTFRAELTSKEKELSKIGVIKDGIYKMFNHFYKRNPGCNINSASMLLTSVSQYVGEEIDDLDMSHFVLMNKSLQNLVGDPLVSSERELAEWRKANELSRFGYSQYHFLNNLVGHYLALLED